MKKMIAGLGLWCIALSSVSFASDWTEYKRIRLKHTPHYFFRVFARSPYLVYNSHWRNFILNTDTGEEQRLPGLIDPVPSPDERFIAIPAFLGAFDRMRFYSTEYLLRGEKAKIYVDKTLPGAYQTIGLLKERSFGNQRYYRLVTESIFNKETGFYIQEYKMTDHGNGYVEVKQQFKKAKRVCPNIVFALPMMSKTGRYVGGVNPKTRETKIMEILPDGNCVERYFIGMPTGKLDFNYDDTEVAFHVTSINERNVTRVTHVVRTPSKRDLKLNVRTLNLRTGEMKEVTQCVDSNCYYPGYTEDGRLVYLEQHKKSDKYEFVFLRKSQASQMQSDWVQAELPASKE